MLKILGVSRSGYNSFKRRVPSDMNKRKEYIKVQIKQIHDESYQNYGAPKITHGDYNKMEKPYQKKQ
ncbi:hypothetical protein [Serpentinicella alkaliphila]|uniref:hypothetical protein n=1 Tax=Serpentinicella alkaliphila TaxID=1734049 RepID=UPI00201A698F|nr:hypothetical protein [Serpentinicella alkaliphila]